MSAKRKKTSSNKLEIQFELLRTVLAIAIAIAIVSVIVGFVSDEPMFAIKQLLVGPLSSKKRFSNVLELMIPLSFTGLAITIVFKTKRYNLAAESAFFMGSMVALLVGLYSPFSRIPTIILAFLLGFLAGGLIGWIPAVANHKLGSSELVISLMLNYVVSYFVNYIFKYKVRDPQKASMQSVPIDSSLRLTKLIKGTRLHSGLILMFVLVFMTWFVMYRTKWGYALRTTGSNEKFAEYSGINVALVVILAQVIGTGFAGLGGTVEMLGMHNTFKWMNSPGYGFDGVIMSTLARGNPALVPLAALFLAYVRVGADVLNRTTSLPSEIVAIIQAVIILLVAADAFLSKTKHKVMVKQMQAIEGSEE